MRMLRCLRVCVSVVIVCLSLVGDAHADGRTEFLIRMLSTSSQFRVRAQAALALGGNVGEPSVVQALTKALRSDDHPAVRAASASALTHAEAPEAVASLRGALRDRDKAVRGAAKRALQEAQTTARASSAPERGSQGSADLRGSIYYVGIGVPSSRVPALSPTLLRALREHVAREIVQISGVRLAPERESHAAAERELKTQKMTGYFIDSSVTSLETKTDGSIRAQVSVIVGTYPGRDMRAMLSGAATVSGGGADESTRLEAVQAAYTGALRRLPQAMQAGLARAP